LLRSAKAYYRAHKAEFIMDWMDTYNPRKASGSKWVPFVLFKRQGEFVQFLEELDRDQQNGLVEKCRDIGATWLAAAYSVACWLFDDDDATGWGSRKEQLVDKIGDADSIFEKMRLILRRLPPEWLPEGYRPKDHATFMKLINPANGATITGEAGDNIGRGGRKSRYMKDESAHYPRPELIEAALGDNTNVQIDISSVNGLGNVFHRRRENGQEWGVKHDIPKGIVRVFVFDWRDHPEKDQHWYDERKAKAIREGMQHVFAQEVDRDYSAAVSNVVIPLEWLNACVDAHLVIPGLDAPKGLVSGALDVADGGVDRNALAIRQDNIVRWSSDWGDRDPGVTTRKVVAFTSAYKGIILQYDSIGVGSAVKSEYNRLIESGELERGRVILNPWNAGAGVIWPHQRVIANDDESASNKNYYGNFKAQAWWAFRTRVYKTWRAVTEGVVYPVDELVSLDSTNPTLQQLKKELGQATYGPGANLKMIIEKTPEGTKSPNLADAVIMAFFPAPAGHNQLLIGNVA
jgi:hypothetical protein